MAFREEAFSFFTHLAGALVALVLLVRMLQRAHGALATTAFAIYGVTLFIMFASSALHHVAHSETGVLRRVDHTAIFLFIAGTYTPGCLIALPHVWGWPVLALVWTLAIAGIALTWLRPHGDRRVKAGIYVAIGWVALIAVYPIVTLFPLIDIILLLGGGLVYSVGAIVYARKRPDPWPRVVGFHGLWHVFVLVGAALHFLLIWRYLPAAS